MRTLVVTGADEAFMPLLRGLVKSLQQWEPRPFTALACLDLGLGSESSEWVSRYAAHVVTPGWDLPVDRQLREKQPHLRALTARPFLPEYFPGYDVYLWIDADAWVQERFALEWYFAAAEEGSLAAVPQVDSSYRHKAGMLDWRARRMQTYFREEAAHRALWDTYFNAGVFALGADAPHWKLWAKHFREGLEATNGSLCCDQTALNHTLWTEDLPVHPLPALCNWLCHLACPGFHVERQRFCEPFTPRRSIGLLHLAAHSKNVSLHLHGDGWTRTSLRFPDSDQLASQWRGEWVGEPHKWSMR
jgi:lipopolysaccharide biosynthesis glycosyltransferase